MNTTSREFKEEEKLEGQNQTKNKAAKAKYTAAFPGRYIQGKGLIAELPATLEPFGKKALILSSHTAFKTVLSEHSQKFSDADIRVEEFNGECCETELSRVSELLKNNHIDVLVGVGGGKAIDTAKIVADRAGIPVVIVPTIASTDAPCSGCAVIYSDQGVFESVYYQKTNPQVVLVDMDVIAHAPVRFLVAGMGDALATWFEARSCERTQSMNECGGYSTLAGFNLARLCYDTILQYGSAAKMACENHLITPALHHVTEANILLSGIGFESSGLAAAHAIHNGLSALEETHAFYHGEKVAFGVLAGLHLTDASPDEMETVYTFCEKTGLPTTLAEIGLEDFSKTNLMKAALKACDPSERIHHEAGEITPEKVLDAMIAADVMGKMRKRYSSLKL
ncbi:MAG: glycerol dehydrogenase [Bacteroidales bacterium]|nr:glycerol dehydrogenase [Bacteroidales bacterium]